jgi:hypothetical protein
MKIPYKFSILRYVHDPVTQEFANIGVVVYSKEARFLGAICAQNYSRITRMFTKIDGERFRQVARYIQNQLQKMGASASVDAPLESLLARILPPDDTAFQFSPAGVGLSEDLNKTLNEVFERFVQRYTVSLDSRRRDDEDVWKIYREPLERRHVLSRLMPKRIVASDYEYEFQHSWKNQLWHMYEPISFDMSDSNSIVDKANRWVGRATSLADSSEPWKIHVLLGEPRDSKMKNAFTKAQNILHKMPGEHDFVKEDEAEHFAESVAEDIKTHLR